jgi:hypothetical protein
VAAQACDVVFGGAVIGRGTGQAPDAPAVEVDVHVATDTRRTDLPSSLFNGLNQAALIFVGTSDG